MGRRRFPPESEREAAGLVKERGVAERQTTVTSRGFTRMCCASGSRSLCSRLESSPAVGVVQRQNCSLPG